MILHKADEMFVSSILGKRKSDERKQKKSYYERHHPAIQSHCEDYFHILAFRQDYIL